jgi:aspartate aminotransferase
MPFFDTIELLPDDPILGLPILFKADPRSQKVNLGVGAYLDADGKPYVLMCVLEAENILRKNLKNLDYLPISGDPDYVSEAAKLAFGADSKLLKEGKIFSAQTVGGTSALRLGADFLVQEIGKNIFLSDPTWTNHRGVFTRAGMKIEFYKYYDRVKHKVDFEGMCASVKTMPPGSAMLLQPCCHNPSGMDLTFDQWKILSDLLKKQQVIPFFDFAYQGFGKGIEDDAKPIRYFAEQGHEMLVAQSFSKDFGLYGERVGLISFVTHSSEIAKNIGSRVRLMIRQNYSNPPRHGARLVATILQSPDLKKQWQDEVQNMRGRIQSMREALCFGLMEKTDKQDFTFLQFQQGMFSFSGLNKDQVMRLRKDHGVYMVDDGRINVAGLNPLNLGYVIDSIVAVINA